MTFHVSLESVVRESFALFFLWIYVVAACAFATSIRAGWRWLRISRLAKRDRSGEHFWARELGKLFDRAILLGFAPPDTQKHMLHSNVFDLEHAQLHVAPRNPRMPSLMFNCHLKPLPKPPQPQHAEDA